MKICIITPTGIYPDKSYGPPIVAYNLSKGFAKIEECTVVAGSDTESPGKRSYHGLDVYFFEKDWGWPKEVKVEEYLSKTSLPLSMATQIPKTTLDLLDIVSELKPDVVLFNLLPIGPPLIIPYLLKKRGYMIAARAPVWFPKELEKQSSKGLLVGLGTDIYKKLVTRIY